MKWHFEGQQIEKEKYTWEAIYNDGTILKQFDDQGQFHQFKEIDQDRLIAFRMVGDTTYTIPFTKGMKLIHYYDNYTLNAKTPQENKFRVYCFGYEMGHVKLVTMIFPHETIITREPEKVLLG